MNRLQVISNRATVCRDPVVCAIASASSRIRPIIPPRAVVRLDVGQWEGGLSAPLYRPKTMPSSRYICLISFRMSFSSGDGSSRRVLMMMGEDASGTSSGA